MSKMCYQTVPERTLYIDLPNSGGLKIKGILRGELTKPLVVMMHGRPGTGNELLQYLGARYLYEHGFSSLRLFMYDFEPKTRNLLDCTLQTHADDFDVVVDYLRNKKVPKLFALGHSYGGLTILKSKAKLNGGVLWDPTHGSFRQENRGEKYSPGMFHEKVIGGLCIGLDGSGYVIPQAMEEQDRAMGDTSEWAAGKGYPLKLIAAGKGAMADLGKKYIQAADEPKKFVEIAEAHHQFEDSDEVVLELLDETAKWFKEIMNDSF